MTSTYGPIITSSDVEDAVRATLQRWLDTMLGEVERQSGDRWELRQIQRPKSWQLVTDYKAPAADRRLPCVAVEYGPMELVNGNDGLVNSQTAMNVIVITKGQGRDKTRETLAGLLAGVLLVFQKHGDLDGFAVGTVIGTIEPDAVPAEKARTVAGARIPIVVLVDRVMSRRGGPAEPDPPEPDSLPDESPEYPDHTSTTVAVAYKEA
jgi:hypothetical protein